MQTVVTESCLHIHNNDNDDLVFYIPFNIKSYREKGDKDRPCAMKHSRARDEFCLSAEFKPGISRSKVWGANHSAIQTLPCLLYEHGLSSQLLPSQPA